MKNFGQIIHRTQDNSYVIEEGTYHVPNNDEFKKLWEEVHAYALAHPDMVTEERPYVPTLDEVKAQKITSLKAERDNLEVMPIEYNGKPFDYDEKARDRINAAIIALDLQGENAYLSWTTADNSEAIMTANDLRMVIAAVAVRSNALHVAYRVAKNAVMAAETVEAVQAVVLGV